MANDLLHHTIMRVARIGRNGEGINVGVATIVLFTNMTIKMAVLSIPVEVAVCTPRAITRGKIAISTLSTENYKAVTIMAVVVVAEATMRML